MVRIYNATNPHRLRNIVLTAIGVLVLLFLLLPYVFGRRAIVRSPVIFVPAAATPVTNQVSLPPVPTVPDKVVTLTPYPVASPVTISAPQGVVEQAGATIRLFIINPEALDQNQVRHPGIYAQTNVTNVPVNFTLDVPQNYVGIVGGTVIDNVGNGVYQALPPGTHNRTIINGFALIVRQSWAQEEWAFRLNEARTFGWAMSNINPGPLQSGTSASLPTSQPVPAQAIVTAQTPLVTTNQRQATGVNGTLRFLAGVSVCGSRVVLDNGRSYSDVCFSSVPVPGSVTNGVVYPWPTEFKAANINP